jgi:hypothetical protein
MNPHIWDNFVDFGIVPNYILIELSNKIKQNVNLDEQELSVYINNSDEIENLIKNNYEEI